MRSTAYQPELDALRFFAFAGVFAYHSHPRGPILDLVVGTGAFGLSMFFLLSSFLITSTLMREAANTGTVCVRAFLIRRALRIAPLYLLGIGIGVVGGPLLLHQAMRWQAVVSLLLMLTNLYVLRQGFFSLLIDPLWSLAIEEQFYVVVPWIMRARARWLKCFYGAFLVIGLLVQAWLSLVDRAPFIRLWLNSFVQFEFFAAGGLLALWLDGRDVHWPPARRALLAVLGCGSLLGASRSLHILHGKETACPAGVFFGFVLALLGTVCLFCALYQSPLTMPRAIVYLGKISFGAYVFHQPYLTLFLGNGRPPILKLMFGHPSAGVLCAMACTLATAACSYRYYERQFRLIKRRFEVLPTVQL